MLPKPHSGHAGLIYLALHFKVDAVTSLLKKVIQRLLVNKNPIITHPNTWTYHQIIQEYTAINGKKTDFHSRCLRNRGNGRPGRKQAASLGLTGNIKAWRAGHKDNYTEETNHIFVTESPFAPQLLVM